MNDYHADLERIARGEKPENPFLCPRAEQLICADEIYNLPHIAGEVGTPSFE